MTPEQEEEFNYTAYAYRATQLMEPEWTVKAYKNLCALVNKYIQQAEDAAFDAGRANNGMDFEDRIIWEFEGPNDWRKSREEKKP